MKPIQNVAIPFIRIALVSGMLLFSSLSHSEEKWISGGNGGGALFLSMTATGLMLKDQNQVCMDIGKTSGDQRLADGCTARITNAYRFLHRLATEGKIFSLSWTICGGRWMHDFDTGARCMVAAKEICQVDASGELTDQLECMRIMQNSTWIANKSAQSIKFDADGRPSNQPRGAPSK